jgi:uncharacterized protein (TIGR02145 family)
MEYLLRYNNASNKFISDPVGFEMAYDSALKAFVTNDGRVMKFINGLGGFQIEPANALLQWKADVKRFETSDGSITAYWDGSQTAYVVVDGGGTPPTPSLPSALMPDGRIWMTQNLDITELNADTIGKYYNNDPAMGAVYGRLYTWQEAMNLAANINGWSLPTMAEWEALVAAAGGDQAGKRLKSTSGWNNSANGTDEYNFNGLPGGMYGSGFANLGGYGWWWMATGSSGSSINAYCAIFNSSASRDMVQITTTSKGYYLSVRLIKDE